MRKSLHAILAILFIAVYTSSAFAVAATPNVTASGVVNINTADTSELAKLPRVGLKAAQRIVDYRKEHGAFAKTSDLMQVKGFGQKSFDRLSAYLTVNGASTLNAKVKSTGIRKSRKSPTTAAR
jgi:competence protein ComEA